MVLAAVPVLAATLLPTQPDTAVEWRQIVCLLCGRRAFADALANVALFVPLGVALGWLPWSPRRTIPTAGTLSLALEVAQFAIPGRDPSLTDLVCNMIGAALGAAFAGLGPTLIFPDSRMASRLSVVAAVATGVELGLTAILLATALPDVPYFSSAADLQTTRGPLRLGGSTDPRDDFRGRIDEVRIYRRALTSSEIRADMNVPVGLSQHSADLVAAYGFDEGAGTDLGDRSGHGNTGRIIDAAWTAEGKFGSALLFDGAGDAVVISPAPLLDLTSAMTLEAWIQPTGSPGGQRAVVHKDFDAYFLLVDSRAAPSRPAAGGTFGWSTESLVGPHAVPASAWTHLAVTYDSGLLQLYVNGHPAARRLRWYPGRVLDAVIDGLTVPNATPSASTSIRARLLAGAPLHVRAVGAGPVVALAPLVALHDANRNEILLLAADGADVVFRLRTLAAVLGLDTPGIRVGGALRHVRSGDDLRVTVWRPDRRYCVEVNGRSTCGLGYTLGMGWTLLVYSQIPSGSLTVLLSACWMGILLFPLGYWTRLRWESLVGALIVTAAVIVATSLGGLSVSRPEAAGGLAGLMAGWGCGRWTARAKRQGLAHDRSRRNSSPTA